MRCRPNNFERCVQTPQEYKLAFITETPRCARRRWDRPSSGGSWPAPIGGWENLPASAETGSQPRMPPRPLRRRCVSPNLVARITSAPSGTLADAMPSSDMFNIRLANFFSGNDVLEKYLRMGAQAREGRKGEVPPLHRAARSSFHPRRPAAAQRRRRPALACCPPTHPPAHSPQATPRFQATPPASTTTA